MKNFYLVFSAQLDGKNYAGTMTAANLCSSKKEAEQTAAEWNAAFKRNGTALFT